MFSVTCRAPTTRSFPSSLPALKGFPRVYALALTLVAHTDATIDEATVTRFVQAFQGVAVFTVGELWAVPIMLRSALIENLRRLAVQMVQTSRDRRDAEAWVKRVTAEAEGNGQSSLERSAGRRKAYSDAFVVHALAELREHGAAHPHLVERLADAEALAPGEALVRENRRQAANQVSVGNCVTTLRLLAALDWRVFFEHTSLVEAALRDDPAGVYSRQEFATRDRYRRAVEVLARGSGKPELEVAREAVRTATRAHEAPAKSAPDAIRGHVGYYLVGDGHDAFARALGYRPSLTVRFVHWLQWHPALGYFSTIAGLTLLMAAALALIVGGGWFLPLLVLLLIPASELAIAVVHFLVTQIVSPRVLPRLDFKDGIPGDCTTFVVMPSMLLRANGGASLAERLEVHYLANADHLYFALLTDYADAPQHTRGRIVPHDAVA